MADHLCRNPRCRTPRHQPDCTDQQCAPHPAHPAADGLELCQHHADRLAPDATQAAMLYEELALALAGGGLRGEPVHGSAPDRGINPRAVEARTDIRATLVSWALMVAEERGVSRPADDMHAVAGFLARHAAWLAAHPAAGDCSDELSELAHGKPWRVAYPTGTRVLEIAPCPECEGTVRAVIRPADALLPSELVCDANPEHRWGAAQWHAFRRAVERRAA